MADKVIINCCPTGMVATKEDNPSLPVTPEEIVAAALEAAELGGSIIHLHARGEDSTPTSSPEVYGEIVKEIRSKRPDLVLCLTTSGRNGNDVKSRAAVLDLFGREKPDMASLTLGSMNFAKQASVNRPDDIIYLLEKMNERGIRPELEVFDLGMIDYAKLLLEEGTLKPPLYFNIILGNRGTAAATPETLALFAGRLPIGSVWAGTGIGRAQYPMNSHALSLGGHVRVGLEDNLYFDCDRKTPATNAMLLQRVVELAKTFGREPMAPSSVRNLLGLGTIKS